MHTLYKILTNFLRSNKFFTGVMAFFVVEAAWIALTSKYPMAFDEDFHFGLIKLYAHHWSPFLSHQPSNADAYGAVFRDPSYLYHYLMSFPYRLINVFTHDQTIQVLILRFINIALFAVCLPLYRRFILRLGISKALSNIIVALFVLVPIVPLLAAQINYDNLLLPLTAVALLLTVRFAEEVRSHKHLNATTAFELLAVCLFASLVQYEFLPFFLAIIIYVGIALNRHMKDYNKVWHSFRHSFQVLAGGAKLLLLLAVVVSGMLFFQRYGVNAINYKKLIPDCDKVLNVERCSAYGPWNRNYIDAQNKTGATRSPLVFMADWFDGMWVRSFFAVSGPTTDFETSGPLIIPGLATIALAGIGLMLFVVYAKRIFRHYDKRTLWFIIGTAFIFLSALLLDEYHDFIKTGQPVAINGRYLLPVLVPLMACFALGYAEAFRHRPRLKLLAASVAVLCLLWGGGALTYILRSNDSWYWSNQAVFDVNHAVQHVLWPVVPGTRNPIEFL